MYVHAEQGFPQVRVTSALRPRACQPICPNSIVGPMARPI